MTGYFKGLVKQVTSDANHLAWKQPKPWSGDEIKFSSVSEVEATLDTSRFHVSMPVTGTETYRVDGEIHTAAPGEYFIFNPRQHVEVEGVFKKRVEGFCIFLSEKTIMETAYACGWTAGKSLDSPFDYPWQQQEFMVKNYRLEENSFGQYLLRLRQKLTGTVHGQLMDWDAFYFGLATEFLQTHRQIGKYLKAIPSARMMTKKEIYRRISCAHSYILANYSEPVSLEILEKEALFSKYHIVRMYHRIYGLTPHQHVLHLRVARAKTLLQKDYSPTEVARQLSFSDRRAFAKVFKKLTGVPPSLFPQNK